MKLATLALLVAASFITISGSTRAVAGVDDFESFTVGQSINLQGQWTVQDSFGNTASLFDEAIVDLSGNKVWRMSNAITATSYSNQPFSSKPALVAGETGAQLYNDYGPDHTSPYSPPHSSASAASNLFYGAWDFKSATGAAQPGLALTVSAGASQSPLRMTYLQMRDNGTSLELAFIDTGAGGAFGSAQVVATGLSYTDWHRVEMGITFVDGPGAGNAGNDVVTILVDGNVVHTGTTWESYYYAFNDAVPAPSLRAVNSLLFRSAGTAAVDTLGEGFYFDNVVTSNAPIPEPATLTALAGVAIMGLRRRRA